jgi:hypothetical protein
MRTESNRKALKPEVQKMLDDVAATVAADARKEYIKCDKPQRFNLPEIPDISPRGKTVLDELLKDYKSKISCMRAIMRLPKSEARDVAMAAILEAFTK